MTDDEKPFCSQRALIMGACVSCAKDTALGAAGVVAGLEVTAGGCTPSRSPAQRTNSSSGVARPNEHSSSAAAAPTTIEPHISESLFGILSVGHCGSVSVSNSSQRLDPLIDAPGQLAIGSGANSGRSSYQRAMANHPTLSSWGHAMGTAGASTLVPARGLPPVRGESSLSLPPSPHLQQSGAAAAAPALSLQAPPRSLRYLAPASPGPAPTKLKPVHEHASFESGTHGSGGRAPTSPFALAAAMATTDSELMDCSCTDLAAGLGSDHTASSTHVSFTRALPATGPARKEQQALLQDLGSLHAAAPLRREPAAQHGAQNPSPRPDARAAGRG